ncbi:unnamed protein product [Lepeophtheirus salmonis]|uniref:(salmon louse) hypothetical protein n=1 Tax=Lepeophtheirus salmonis TaxID=72036 RepID=A0A7R8CKX1_LEPSM|nr:unnamed protein product [Lepeophtheirus salmonis]CAF2852429.1 unnamed protein product [Lepeophtheirus salmonis]
MKTRVMSRKPTNLTLREAFAKDEWANIPLNTCRKLVKSYKYRLEAGLSYENWGCAPSDPLVEDLCAQILALGQVNVDVVTGIDSKTSLQQLSQAHEGYFLSDAAEGSISTKFDGPLTNKLGIENRLKGEEAAEFFPKQKIRILSRSSTRKELRTKKIKYVSNS